MLAPCSNVIANNPDFGFLITETGAGFTWSLNSHENRLTPWSNDTVSDPPAEIIYLRDEDSGTTWTPTQRLDAQPMELDWLARSEGGRMVGDYFSVSYAGSRVVPVFTLAAPPLRGRFREAIFAASLPASP